MPSPAGINHQQAVRALERAGFRIVRQSSHSVMRGDARQVTVPRHDPINAYTVGGIIVDACLSVEEFKALL